MPNKNDGNTDHVHFKGFEVVSECHLALVVV